MTMHGATRRPTRGLSLVELMVGVAIGLFITAAAAMLVSTQLVGNRQLLVETQIEQDLRATADIVKRDLRRASYVPTNAAFVSLLDSTSPPVPNPSANIAISAGPAGSSFVEYGYTRGTNTNYALRLTADGVLQRGLGITSGTYAWQPLTDSNVLRITEFTVRPVPAAGFSRQTLACPSLCADGTTACWPTVELRELSIVIQGQSAIGAPVRRQVEQTLRVRNDVVRLSSVSPPRVCP